MNSKNLGNNLTIPVAILIIAAIFGSGFFLGRIFPADNISSFLNGSRPELEILFKPYLQAWDAIHEQYIDQPVNDVELMRGSINGLIRSLGDSNSTYMNPGQYQQYNAPLEGNYSGIGTWVNTGGDYLIIVGIMPGSPAEKAGLKAGDAVIAIDDKDMTGIHPELVLKQIQGPAGSIVKLTVMRKGENIPLTFEITREVINIPAVKSKIIDGNIAYIQLMQYSQDADNEFRAAYKELSKSHPIGLILDLRNNSGGFLETAIQVTSEFINQGNVMIEEHGDKTRQNHPALNDGIALEIPLIALVNQYSASASEITAGAIQDLKRGQLVGVTTYGKGSVQNWIPLLDDNGAIRVTVAHWLTPNGRQIDKNGLTPDVVIQITEDDIKNNNDPQLDQAVKIMLQKTALRN